LYTIPSSMGIDFYKVISENNQNTIILENLSRKALLLFFTV
jgi:hypothetical protein